MKFVELHPFADPDVAALGLLAETEAGLASVISQQASNNFHLPERLRNISTGVRY
jgi:hypothetical protein